MPWGLVSYHLWLVMGEWRQDVLDKIRFDGESPAAP